MSGPAGTGALAAVAYPTHGGTAAGDGAAALSPCQAALAAAALRAEGAAHLLERTGAGASPQPLAEGALLEPLAGASGGERLQHAEVAVRVCDARARRLLLRDAVAARRLGDAPVTRGSLQLRQRRRIESREAGPQVTGVVHADDRQRVERVAFESGFKAGRSEQVVYRDGEFESFRGREERLYFKDRDALDGGVQDLLAYGGQSEFVDLHQLDLEDLADEYMFRGVKWVRGM